MWPLSCLWHEANPDHPLLVRGARKSVSLCSNTASSRHRVTQTQLAWMTQRKSLIFPLLLDSQPDHRRAWSNRSIHSQIVSPANARTRERAKPFPDSLVVERLAQQPLPEERPRVRRPRHHVGPPLRVHQQHQPLFRRIFQRERNNLANPKP